MASMRQRTLVGREVETIMLKPDGYYCSTSCSKRSPVTNLCVYSRKKTETPAQYNILLDTILSMAIVLLFESTVYISSSLGCSVCSVNPFNLHVACINPYHFRNSFWCKPFSFQCLKGFGFPLSSYRSCI